MNLYHFAAGCLIAACYPYAVYPGIVIAVDLLRRPDARTSRSVHGGAKVRFVTVFHNEGATMAAKAAEMTALGPSVFISDGSTDTGPEIVRRIMGPADQLAELPRIGKSAALIAALAQLEHRADEILILSDANVRIPSQLVSALVSAFEDERVDAAAAPILPADSGPERWYWLFENRLRQAEAGLDTAIACSGACWAIKRSILENSEFSGMLCEDQWISLIVLARGGRIAAVDGPPAIESSSGRESTEFRRRSRIMAGNIQIIGRLGEIWSGLSGTRKFLFASHKLLRWFSPALVTAGLLGFSAALVSDGLAIAVSAFWLATLLIGPARYFLLMNLALISGVIRRENSGIWAPERHGS